MKCLDPLCNEEIGECHIEVQFKDKTNFKVGFFCSVECLVTWGSRSLGVEIHQETEYQRLNPIKP